MKLYSKNELRDSRIFFEKEPSHFLGTMALIFGALILVSIAALKFIPKNYIVRAQGTIERSDKQYVAPLTNATIVEINKKKGEKVEEGDILLTLATGGEGAEILEISKQIERLEDKEEIFDRYEKSLKEKVNHMKNGGDEQEYYGKVEYYLGIVKDDNNQQNTQNKTLEKYKKELEALKGELGGIEGENNKEYEKQYNRLKLQLDNKLKL